MGRHSTRGDIKSPFAVYDTELAEAPIYDADNGTVVGPGPQDR
jgi:hypothetical protein